MIFIDRLSTRIRKKPLSALHQQETKSLKNVDFTKKIQLYEKIQFFNRITRNA